MRLLLQLSRHSVTEPSSGTGSQGLVAGHESGAKPGPCISYCSPRLVTLPREAQTHRGGPWVWCPPQRHQCCPGHVSADRMPSDLVPPGLQAGRALGRAHRGWEGEEEKDLGKVCGGGTQGEVREVRALLHLHTSFLLFFCSFTSFSEFEFMPSTPSKVYDGSF